MEARVDVRKLQILNDRINQTIDALNQVRVSVHGLGHTSGISPNVNPFLGQGPGMQQGLGMQSPYGFAQSPYGFGAQGMFPGSQFGGQQHGIPGISGSLGFQHSPLNPYPNPLTNPYVSQGVANPFTNPGVANPFTNPYVSQGVANPWGLGQTPFTGTPWGGIGGAAGGFGGGQFHSSPEFIDKQIAEVRASDPYRISQTFPFVIP